MMTTTQFSNLTRGWMLGALLAIALLAGSAQAAVWSFTNKNDTAWATGTNWNPNTVPPLGANNYPGRFNVGAATPAHATNVTLIYDSPLTTGFGTIISASPEFGRGLAVANGSGTFATLRVVNGALNIYQAALIDAAIVCAPGNSVSTSQGHLLLDGGNLTVIATNYGVLSFPFRGSSNSLGMVTVQNGSILKVDRLRFGGTGAFNDIGVDLPGVLNLNSGGTVLMRNIGNLLRPENLRATNNFNGGTIKVLAAESAGEGRNPLIGSNIVNRVLAGGLIVDTAGFDARIVSPLFNGSAGIDGGITKLGAGNLSLRGVGSTYTGPTIVNAGTLGVQVPMTSTDFRVQTGAALNFIPDNFAPWVVPSLGLTNASLGFDYGIFAGYTNAVVSVSTLNLQGTITVNLVGTSFPVTNLTLLTYGSKTGGGSFALGSLPSGAAATLTDTGSSLELNITAASLQNLTWSGGDGIWRTNGALNWNGGAAVYLEYGPSGDIVNFDDTVGGTVSIPSIVKPASITVNNTFTVCVFTGAGGISGPTDLDKEGSSTLQIDTSNDFTGEIRVNGGTLFVNHPNALGATNGATTVYGPANTLEIGIPGGSGVTVSDETATISGTGFGGARGALRGAATATGSNVWAGPVILGDNTARIGTEDGGNLTVSGSIYDGGLNLPMLFRPGASSTMVVSGQTNSWAGDTTVFGSDQSSLVLLGRENVFPTNSLVLLGGACVLELNGFSQTFAGLGLAAGGNTVPTTVSNSSTAATLTLRPKVSQDYPGDIAGNLSIVLQGTNTQRFSGLNLTYSGTTLVAGGRLDLTSVSPIASSITVAAGAVLGGEATTTGSLTLNANSGVIVDPATVGSFTANTIDASAGPILVTFTGVPSPTEPTAVLTASTSISGNAANFQAQGSRGGTFSIVANQVLFTPVAPTALTWKGDNALNPTFWDTVTTNWLQLGTPDKFFLGDNVVFNDTAASFAVEVQGSAAPTAVTFDNSVNPYLVYGGGIAGSAGVEKFGTSSVTLSNANSYTGTTTIKAGTLILRNNAALGSALGETIVTNSGTLDVGGMNLGAEILRISGNGVGGSGAVVNNSGVDQINAVQQLVLAGTATIGGSNRWDLRGSLNTLDMGGFNLTKTGSNLVALVGTAVNNPGNIEVQQGSFGMHLGVFLSGGLANTLKIGSGATYNTYQSSIPPDWTLVMNDGSTWYSENGAAGQNIWAGPVNLLGAATLRAAAVIAINGDISGAGSILKAGGSSVTFAGATVYRGDTTIEAGSLVLTGAASLSNSPAITINTNATLDVSGISFALGSSQTLQGGGRVIGDAMVNGTLVPGLSVGALTFSNNLTIGGKVIVELDKSLAQRNDLVNVVGGLTNTGTGTLAVSNLGPSLVVGEKFILFSKPVVNGNLLTIVPPTGVTFANNLNVDGSITVESVQTVQPPTLNFVRTESGLQFSWTGGSKLQAQTNSLGVGLSKNWFDYPGGGTSPVPVPVDAAQGAVFFRLISQ